MFKAALFSAAICQSVGLESEAHPHGDRKVRMHLSSSYFFYNNAKLNAEVHLDEKIWQQMHMSFDDYLSLHGKSYSDEHYDTRKENFENNMDKIRQQNTKMDRTWLAGPNKFTDMTNEEFSKMLGFDMAAHREFQQKRAMSMSMKKISYNNTAAVKRGITTDLDVINWAAIPSGTEIFDGENSKKTQAMTNFLSKVPDQGQCGSCWAFGAVGSMNGIANIKNFAQGKSVNPHFTLSHQELVDCTANKAQCGGAGGCTGSTAELALAYMQKYGLLETTPIEQSSFGNDVEKTCAKDEMPGWTYCSGGYPGCQGVHGNVRNLCQPAGAEICGADRKDRTENSRLWCIADDLQTGFRTLTNPDIDTVVEALKTGPVTIAIAATEWMNYQSGNFQYSSHNSATEVNHAVLLVGYDKVNKRMLIQNSWGPGWGMTAHGSTGEKGYISIGLPGNSADKCGIDYKPQDGLACADDVAAGNTEVKVRGPGGSLFSIVQVGPSFARCTKQDVARIQDNLKTYGTDYCTDAKNKGRVGSNFGEAKVVDGCDNL